MLCSSPPHEVERLIATVTIVGRADTIVPCSHGRHTAERIRGARLATFPDDGHLSMIMRVPDICAQLVAAYTT
jgi:pimeloyl-ACP methyl ester carboxylesterase